MTAPLGSHSEVVKCGPGMLLGVEGGGPRVSWAHSSLMALTRKSRQLKAWEEKTNRSPKGSAIKPTDRGLSKEPGS